jgi:hypothetical protein
MSSNGLTLHAGLLRQLSAEPLSQSATAETIAASEEGLELLEYVATCALDADATVTVGAHEFAGALGLAPEWRDGACGASCQKWVSACLLAHANALGVEVPIWLRAEHPALGDGDGAPEGFTYQEGAFYGDVFSAAGPQMFACVGRGLVQGTEATGTIVQIEDAEDYLHDRLCSLGDQCGVQSTGICHAVGGIATCDDDAGAAGAFGDCHTAFIARDGDLGTSQYAEVITVYLEADD